MWDVTARPCPNFNDVFNKPLRLGHAWVITSHCFTMMQLLVHTIIPIPDQSGHSHLINAVSFLLNKILQKIFYPMFSIDFLHFYTLEMRFRVYLSNASSNHIRSKHHNEHCQNGHRESIKTCLYDQHVYDSIKIRALICPQCVPRRVCA